MKGYVTAVNRPLREVVNGLDPIASHHRHAFFVDENRHAGRRDGPSVAPVTAIRLPSGVKETQNAVSDATTAAGYSAGGSATLCIDLRTEVQN
ncbi:hypothetical protein [Paraburkholderia sp. BCC1885]|uniref:hypothetical protein n=1 Tax=Paraburkholderia sp. BCC1885 TaxID=2562669 RepID=UPI001183FBD5|nr:hypothetical protein [Paraburkholderia sp. BCC1885]